MILVSEIYDNLLALIRKDKRGLSFSPDDFNAILPALNQRIYRLNYADFEESKLSMDETGSFKVVNYPIALDGNGVGTLPVNYMHLVGDPYYLYTSLDGKYVAARRKIELVTSLEFGSRQMDYLTKATDLYPLCFVGYGATSDDMSVYVTPVTATPIYIDYLRKVVVPFLDYYVNDTTLEITYLAQGATVAIGAGYTARNGTTGPANIVSTTLDFDWHEHDVPQIINLLLEAVGINLPDELLVQDSAKNLPLIENA
jgi:hypothetical protein